MFKKVSLAAVVALGTVLTGCGGGGGGGGSDPSGNGGNPDPVVAGPTDTLQASLSDTLISPLKNAAAGTPLEDVLACTDSIVNQNILDIADAIAGALANPATLGATAPAEAQAAVMSLVSNLSGYLNSLSSLTNVATCTGDALGGATLPSGNPLAGGPLAAFGTQLLPALTTIQAMLPTDGSQLSAAQLDQIVTLLSGAFNSGLAGLPVGTDLSALPIIGGSLLSMQDALNQLKLLTDLVNPGSGTPNPTAIAGQFQDLVQTVLSGQLTELLPIGDLQNSSNLVQTFTAAITQLTSSLGTIGGGGTIPNLPTNPLNGLGFAALDDLITQLTSVNGGLPSLPGATTLLQLLTAGGSNPLTGLLDQLFGNLGGGTGGSCPLPILGPILGLCPSNT